ncbi:MAG TPA: hypothetical protein PK275_05765 [Chitinophagaceae bacterium]|mgnify:CR=1 FL=1|nr:hypothetical protein [Chitinophagaceae bacterium]
MWKIILSDKKTSFVIVTLAIVARLIQIVFFYNIRVDGMYQMMAMQNFVAGHGFSASYVLPTDLSTIIYEPQINWPPGYSLLLAPFYLLMNQNFIYAGIALELLGAIGFIFITRRILKQLSVPDYLNNIFTIISGFFIYPFYFICSSDAVAVTFLLFAISISIKLIQSQKRNLSLSLGIAFFLFQAATIKYLVIPIIFIVPILMYLKANADKNMRLKKSSTYIFSFLVFAIGGLLLWQKINSGAATYISSGERGFFPENILGSYPAIPASFLNPDTVSMVMGNTPKIQNSIFRLFQILNFAAFLFACIVFIRYILKYGFKNLSIIKYFFSTTFLMSTAIIGLLSFLSLFVGKEENFPGHWWSYVDEPRYYGPLMILFQLSFFVFCAAKTNMKKIYRIAIIVAFLLLSVEALRGFIFTFRRAMNAGNETYSWQQEKEIQDYAEAVIKFQLQKNPGYKAAVTGSSYYIYYRVGMNSKIPVMNETIPLIQKSNLTTKKPMLLFIITNDGDEIDFAMQHQATIVGKSGGYNFYMQKIDAAH